MAKLLSGQYDALKEEVTQAIREQFCRKPSKDELDAIKNQIAADIPEFNSLMSELFVQLDIIESAREQAENISHKLQNIANGKYPGDYIYLRNGIANRRDINDFLTTIAKRRAYETGLTVTLSSEGERMISNAVYMAPTRGREMSEIRDVVIQNVSDRIKENPEKYLKR